MLMDIECNTSEEVEKIKKEKQPKQKKIKDPAKTDRLIARMILGIGLSLTVASAVACGITHPKFSDVKDAHWDAINSKNAYLDAYEQTDEFKTAYNTDVTAISDRLIAREITGDTYDKELEKLNDNEYTEKVLVENANEKTKAEFNEVNQKYLDTKAEWDKQAMPSAITSLSAFAMPILTAGSYYIWKPRKKYNEHEVDFEHHISEETFKRVMKLKDLPPYHPINADETRKVEIVHDEKLGVLRAVENQPNTAIPNIPRSVEACIIKTEEQNNL